MEAQNDRPSIIAMAKQFYFGCFRFHGRARRSEFVGFVFGAPVVALIVVPAGMMLADSATSVISGRAIGWIASLPLFAFFARRLHDINLSGWWSLFILPVLALNVAKDLNMAVIMREVSQQWQFTVPTWAEIVQVLLIIASYAVVLSPGTLGANRFGPDPRGSVRAT